jgi:hypothetical protein
MGSRLPATCELRPAWVVHRSSDASSCLYLRIAEYLRQLGLDKHYIYALEDYAQTQATPKVSHVLYSLHKQQKAVLKAKNWLERGVEECDPESVMTHVRFDENSRISLLPTRV